MKAAVLRDGGVVVRDDVADPTPGFGAGARAGAGVRHLRLRPPLRQARRRRCWSWRGEMEGLPDLGPAPELDLGRDVFMGHEFAGRGARGRPGHRRAGAGHDRDVDPDPADDDRASRPIVYTNDLPCGYGERMLLSAPLLLPGAQRARPPPRRADRADGGRPPRRQPVGHRRRRRRPGARLRAGRAGRDRRAAGCGASSRIVAADFSAGPAGGGASPWAPHEAVDPGDGAGVRRRGRGPVAAAPVVVFEAIGVPGIIDEALRLAPAGARIVVVGVCMGRDTITPFYGIGKELSVQFVLGLRPDGVRRQPAHDRRGRDRRDAADHRRGRPRRRARRLRRARRSRRALQDPRHPVTLRRRTAAARTDATFAGLCASAYTRCGVAGRAA